MAEPQKPTDPEASDDESGPGEILLAVAGPAEAVVYLTKVLRDTETDTRYKIMAAGGIVNYHLAMEIAGLIDEISSQHAHAMQAWLNQVEPRGVPRAEGEGDG